MQDHTCGEGAAVNMRWMRPQNPCVQPARRTEQSYSYVQHSQM